MTARNKNFGSIEPPTEIVCIEWIDASGQQGPINRHELSGVFKLRSVGWLIRETDDHVSICMDYVPENDEFREVQHILKINIVGRKEFEI